MQTSQSMKVKFWGVRGSHPTPGPDTVLVGGNTPCVEICAGDQVILLDAGTGIIALGRDLIQRSLHSSVSIEVTLLFSHIHHDHTQGFPFFGPAYIPSTRLYIFGPQPFAHDLDQVLAQNMVPPVFPVTLQDMGAAKEIHSLSENQKLVLRAAGSVPELVALGTAFRDAAAVDAGAVQIRVMRSPAHPGGVLIYRVEWRGQVVVYATDTEGYANTDRRLANFARGADLLIHDAQYTEAHYLGLLPGTRSTQGWGHSTHRMACEVAQAAGVKRLALFHFDPTYSDETVAGIEAESQAHFPGAFAAREGLEIWLGGDAPEARQRLNADRRVQGGESGNAVGYNEPICPPFKFAAAE
jgi:phosphoribosyl 1,2-cyclic phosphodiesterase